MGIELKISEALDQARAEGFNPAQLRRKIRQREQTDALQSDYAELEAAFRNPDHHLDFAEAKRFLQAPTNGEANFGAVLADVKAAIRGNDERKLMEASFVGLRMMIRQAYPMGNKGFGENP